MRVRLSERARVVLLVAGLAVTALGATAALAKLVLPEVGPDSRPEPRTGIPVSGVRAPVLVPIIDIPPVEVTPRADEGGRAKGKEKGAPGRGRGKAKGKAKNGDHSHGSGRPDGAGGSTGGGQGGSGGKGGGKSAASGKGAGAGSGKKRA
jgi:hypothetical protein